MAKLLDTVILIALPASGKSEVRKYLDGLSPEQCREEFCMPVTRLVPYYHDYALDQPVAREFAAGATSETLPAISPQVRDQGRVA